MNKTNIIFHLTPEYLQTQSGVFEGAMKAGAKGAYILDIFNKCFCSNSANFYNEMKAWTDQMVRTVFNNNQSKAYPVKECILSLRSNFWCDMTQKQIDESKCEFKQAKPVDFYATTQYSNRFMPDDDGLYVERLRMFLDYLVTIKIDGKPVIDRITFDLWGEPDAKRYWWGTFEEFKHLTLIKYDMLGQYGFGCKMLMPHLTARSLMMKDAKNKKYINFVNTNGYYNEPNVGYSLSLYEHFENSGMFMYDNNLYPTREFNRTVFTECGYAVGLNPASKSIYEQDKIKYFNSPMMMHYFVRLLNFADSKGVDTICLFTLCDAIEGDNRGELAYMKHLDGGGYTPRNVWYVWLDLMSVIRDGWTPIIGGIQGDNGKKIILTETGYDIH